MGTTLAVSHASRTVILPHLRYAPVSPNSHVVLQSRASFFLGKVFSLPPTKRSLRIMQGTGFPSVGLLSRLFAVRFLLLVTTLSTLHSLPSSTHFCSRNRPWSFKHILRTVHHLFGRFVLVIFLFACNCFLLLWYI